MGSTYLFSLLELLLLVVALEVETVVAKEVLGAEVSTSYEAISLRMSFTELSFASIQPSLSMCRGGSSLMNCLANTLPIWVTMSADCCTTIDPSCEDNDDADDDNDGWMDG